MSYLVNLGFALVRNTRRNLGEREIIVEGHYKSVRNNPGLRNNPGYFEFFQTVTSVTPV